MAPSPLLTGRNGLGIMQGNASRAQARRVGIDFVPEISPLVVARNFEKLELDIRSFHEPLKRSVQQVISPSIKKNFEVGGRPPWEPLADATIEIREREGYAGGKPLVKTKKLMKVAQQLNIWTIDREQAYVGNLQNKLNYAVPQHEGSTSGFVTVPARPFIVMQPDDFDKVEKVFADWIEERATRAGLAVV